MSTIPNTPTPETDAAACRGAYMQDPSLYPETIGKQLVHIDDSRRLERERDAARAEIEAMREAIREVYAALDACSHNLHSAYGKLSDNADAALAKLQPFIKP